MEGSVLKRENSLEYLVSRSILKELVKDDLITEEEFAKIDSENRKTFNK
jgi:SHOCT-like protein